MANDENHTAGRVDHVRAHVVSHAVLANELDEAVENHLGDEPVVLRKDTPSTGYDSIEFGAGGGPLHVTVEYAMGGSVPQPIAVRYVSELRSFRIRPDGSCASSTGRPNPECAARPRSEWKEFFADVSALAALSNLVPGLPVSYEP